MAQPTSDLILGVIQKKSWILDHFEIFVAFNDSWEKTATVKSATVIKETEKLYMAFCNYVARSIYSTFSSRHRLLAILLLPFFQVAVLRCTL